MRHKSIKKVEKAGVIYVMEEAAKFGFTRKDKYWINLGQGAPELGRIGRSPKRKRKIKIPQLSNSYAPVAGIHELRSKVAELYNTLFRNLKNEFSCENVLIGGGGRLVLSRIFGSLEKGTNLGHFNPDYASYEGIMSVFNNCNLFNFKLDESSNFQLDLLKLEEWIKKKCINVLLLSNPSNPTGNLMSEEKLRELLNITRNNDVLLIIDEFYMNYIYDNEKKIISIAEFIDNIELDNVIIIGGLTKPWRYPGWRIAWAIASKDMISTFSNTGSFLDGGANHPLQEASLDLINVKTLLKETDEIQKRFREKRDFAIDSLNNLGLEIVNKPGGAFYLWVNVSKLPSLINDGMSFFEECLKEKVIVVPGLFFDIEPTKSLNQKHFNSYVRISYSTSFDKLRTGISRIAKVIEKFQ